MVLFSRVLCCSVLPGLVQSGLVVYGVVGCSKVGHGSVWLRRR